MIRKSDSAALRLITTLIHLALWAQLGVFTRVFLDKFLTLGCSGGWGPCLGAGVYFKDLPANMLGCFLMGLFAASSTLGLATPKALAVLPAGHSWQSNFELQIGMRTGYCGSLTTFASWQLELIMLAVTNNKWVEAAAGYFTGMFCSVICYVIGMHAALGVDRWLMGDRRVFEELQVYRQSQAEFVEGMREDSGDTPSQRLMMQAEPDLPRLVAAGSHKLTPGSSGLQPQQQHHLQGSVVPAGSNSTAAVTAAAVAAAASVEEGAEARGAAAAAPEAAAQLKARPSSEAKKNNGAQPGAFNASSSSSDVKQQAAVEQSLSIGELGSSLSRYRTDLAALMLLALCTAALAIGVGLESDHKWLRTNWVACLLGPLGCTLRWWLSRFNYRLPGGWAWFPAGTFAANMLGTATDFGLECVLQRRPVAIGYWGSLVTTATQSGFCGSLTTVSTFVAEVVKFAEAIPENFRSYSYALLSLGCGILLGLGIYGWTEWAYS